MRLSLAFASLVLIPIACGGDMDELPDNDTAFQQKVDAFVKPGDRSHDAVARLEQLHFKCESLSSTQTWCRRLEFTLSSVKHRYQVVLTIRDGRVVAANATTGLVGP